MQLCEILLLLLLIYLHSLCVSELEELSKDPDYLRRIEEQEALSLEARKIEEEEARVRKEEWIARDLALHSLWLKRKEKEERLLIENKLKEVYTWPLFTFIFNFLQYNCINTLHSHVVSIVLLICMHQHQRKLIKWKLYDVISRNLSFNLLCIDFIVQNFGSYLILSSSSFNFQEKLKKEFEYSLQKDFSSVNKLESQVRHLVVKISFVICILSVIYLLLITYIFIYSFIIFFTMFYNK